MAAKSKLNKAAQIALQEFMKLDEEEILLVVTDDEKRDIGLAFFDEGKRLCEEAFYIEMKVREIDGEEPPEQIAEMMESVDVVVCPTTKSLTHTDARRIAANQGVRVGTMPGITAETMIRCFDPDYQQTVETTKKVYDRIKKGKEFHVTSEKGTNVKFVREDRRMFQSTGVLRNIGESGNLPSGEVYFAPIEEKINGTIVFDGSFGGLGLLENPITVDVVDGYGDKLSGFALAKRLSRMINKFGEKARTICKFGIGTNEKAELCGNILEDEKVLGTVHFAFGNNVSMGGNLDVPIHLDGIVTNPTLIVDGEKLIDKGKLLIL